MSSGRAEWIFGRVPIYEALRARRRHVNEIRVAKTVEVRGALAQALSLARDGNVPIKRVSKSELDTVHAGHQGVVASVDPYPYIGMRELLDHVKSVEDLPCLLILDGLQDPQNVGALLRTSEAVGVHGVILPYRRTAGITPAVVRASAGACEHLRVVRANLAQAIDLLKKLDDMWVVGLENTPDATVIDDADLRRGLALVVGSEGRGIRPLVRERCDYFMKIPMRGEVESLNASVAGAMALYAIWRQRGYAGAH